MEDLLLIQGCIHGDRNSQRKLYEFYAPKMMVVCLRYSKTREEAEEVLQEGFIRVFAKIEQFKNEGSFEGWVRKIMVNSALQKYRSQKKLHPIINIEAAGHEQADVEYVLPQLSAKELLGHVQQLPPAYKMVFNLYAFEGMKHKEIAELLGISEGTSKSNLSDARALLQRAVTRSMRIAKQTNP